MTPSYQTSAAIIRQLSDHALVLAELGTQQAYRGDGIFLGWPQEKLAAVYAALVAQRDEPPFDLPQLG